MCCWVRLLVCGAVMMVAATVLPAQGFPMPSPRGTPVRAALGKSADKFFAKWREAWLASESERLRRAATRGAPSPSADGRRVSYLHCHARGLGGIAEASYSTAVGDAPIRSDFTPFSVCPSWWHGGQPLDLPNESRTTDAGLTPARRAAIRMLRTPLIAQAAAASRAHPDDDFLVGQHVRLLLDQEWPDSALAVVEACRASAWWCAALRGYTEWHRGDRARAESSFDDARAVMPPLLRCVWDDVLELLPADSLPTGSARSCRVRMELSARYWWLADPLFTEPGNERRFEHDVRQTQVALRSSFATDGRTRWENKYGGDAMTRMVMRYGWPTGVAWGGPEEDSNHSAWLTRLGGSVQPPYTTFEYTRGRIHTAPEWWALQSPFLATDSAWQLNAPANLAADAWWPVEHFARSRALLQLHEGQQVVFRRHHDVLVASAHAIDSATRALFADTDVATLVLSPVPDSLAVVDTRALPASHPLVMRARVPASPTLVAVELRGRTNTVDARTRRGMIPPLPLDSMGQWERALSDPVLLRPVESAEALARGDSIVDLMLGSTRLRRGVDTRVTLYWESYGYAPNDSVDVSIRVTPLDKTGFGRRLLENLSMIDRSRAELTIAWREPSPARARFTIDGPVPTVGRAVTLDFTPLHPGSYALVVRMQRQGEPPAESRRDFRIEP